MEAAVEGRVEVPDLEEAARPAKERRTGADVRIAAAVKGSRRWEGRASRGEAEVEVGRCWARG